MRISRRLFSAVLTSGVLAAMAAMAMAGGYKNAGGDEVVNLAGPTSVTVGNSFNATVEVNQVPMNVVIQSSPAGLVSKTVTQTSLTQTHSVETNSTATPANYQLVATPVGSSVGVSVGIAAQPSTSNQRR